MSMMSCLTIFSGSSAIDHIVYVGSEEQRNAVQDAHMWCRDLPRCAAAAFACHCNAYDAYAVEGLSARPDGLEWRQLSKRSRNAPTSSSVSIATDTHMALDNPRSQVAHLLRRAGFGATEAELDQYTPLGFAGALDRLLNPEQVDDSATDQLLAPLTTDLGDPKKIEAAKFWWFNRMLYTQRPLQEKMTLFWHNHFATANSKVNNSVLMQQQIQLFRDNGLGSFETLLQKVTRDPATLIWLDNRMNRKGATNENFAREVQELFTVGIGNYTEQDIKEAARAFTGHTLDKNLKYTFNKASTMPAKRPSRARPATSTPTTSSASWSAIRPRHGSSPRSCSRTSPTTIQTRPRSIGWRIPS